MRCNGGVGRAAVFAIAVLFGIGCGEASTDEQHTLVLKDGSALRGELVGRGDGGFRFAVGGEVREFPESDVHSLTLKPGEPPLFLASAEVPEPAPKPPARPAPPRAVPAPAPKPAPAPSAAPAPAPKPAPAPVAAPAPAPAPSPVTVAAGTRVMLKLDEDISTKTHPRGAPISGTLDAPLKAGGVVVADRGTKVYGRVIESAGGNRVRNQKLVAEFTTITIGDDLVPIDTDRVGAEGGGGSGVRKVGAGALVGGAFGGKSGAGKGALVGAGLSVLSGGTHIKVPRGTLMELHLRTPLTVDN